MRKTLVLSIIAAGLFFPLFIFTGKWNIDFWWWMAINIGILLLLVNISDPEWRIEIRSDIKDQLIKKIGLGIFSAVALYLIFAIGNYLSQTLFDFARTEIAAVYAYKSSASPLRIGILMLLIIGPGEELFWRGFVQRRFQNDTGQWPGFILTTGIYTFIHLGSGNIMLILAAGICGLFWGYLYLRYRSMLLNAVSHTIWDILIFIILPVNF
ncbi:MAG: CPBP family intramembrane metalloprotease [Candidatus Marinimicrobia bacterium]|nr:CPBP family intramembrane metalloprotease [Candidatus Neomarinimicrobiota bacterium]